MNKKNIWIILSIIFVIIASSIVVISMIVFNKNSIDSTSNTSNRNNVNSIIQSHAFDKVDHEWDSHAFLDYVNIPDNNRLGRFNITNFRNKFAYSKYQNPKNQYEEPTFKPKTFSSGIFMMMKNNPKLKIVRQISGKVKANIGDWLLIWTDQEFTPDNYPSKYNAIIKSDGRLSRDFQDFDFIEENGHVILYKIFDVWCPGTQKIVNRIYQTDRVMYYDMEVIIEPEK
jgi:hypothetical protein